MLSKCCKPQESIKSRKAFRLRWFLTVKFYGECRKVYFAIGSLWDISDDATKLENNHDIKYMSKRVDLSCVHDAIHTLDLIHKCVLNVSRFIFIFISWSQVRSFNFRNFFLRKTTLKFLWPSSNLITHFCFPMRCA